jgi:hypothetical protein
LEPAQDGEKRLPEQALSNFRQTPAWVLLGEPGAGKSEALKMEAEATGGQYLSARELITATPVPQQWLGKTLYIDALDESRAEGVDSLALRIGSQLRHLDCPPFRLACRAADWYGPSDRTDLQHLSPDGKLIALQLCPLSDENICHILRSNHGIGDPEEFAERAERHGIAPLLRNPQTLGLIAKAIREGHWPKNRADVYRLACETLAEENNRRHRDMQRANPIETLAILQAAGQLFAVLLLAGKSGIALDQDASNSEFPTLQQLLPADTATATKALQSALFIPAASHDERMTPCHRSVAEYLAANWLGKRLDDSELPLGRLLNLLLGCDGGVVADLRGLFAWLTQCSTVARPRLIDIDPLGIVLYGDARPLSTADKRHLLQALHQQAERFPGFRWYLQHDQEAFGALADQALIEDFRQILQDPQRGEATQALMDCVLDTLRYGGAMAALAELLLAMAKDATLWLRLRKSALAIWLELSHSGEAKELLEEIGSGQVEDGDDELLGCLLGRLYPTNLEPDELLRHLHPPKDTRLVGNYLMFWDYRLPEQAPIHHLPALLEELSQRRDMFGGTRLDGNLSRATGHLLARALETLGDAASDEQLFTWLGAGADAYGRIRREKQQQSIIQQWFESRPERYQAVLGLCIRASTQGHRHYYHARLPHASPPADLGLWHLQQAAIAHDAIARIHLDEAVQAIELQRGDQDLSLETLAEWMRHNPERAAWLDKFLVCPIEDWRQEDAARTSQYKRKRLEERHKRTLEIAPYLPAIAAGTAAAHLLDQLAGVWLKHFADIHGETPSERFANYSALGDKLMQAAESGFKLSLQRDDLPSADEIIALGLKKKRHWINQPCLLGLQLLWEEDPQQAQALSDDLVERLLAFRLNMPFVALDAWLAQIARQRPELFANLLVRYAGTALKAGESSVELIHLLGKGDDYAQVSALAIPQLLRNFPLRAKKDQLHSLKRLLNTALVTAPNALEELVRHKLSLKGVDAAQKTLWFATALLLAPERHEQALWRHIGKSPTRASLLAEFICQGFDSRASRAPIPEHTLGRLIELIAPHAELERASGEVTEAWERGDQIRAMINQLGASISAEAEQELQRLLANPDLNKLRYTIQSTLDQQRNKRREAQFSFLAPEAVAHVLANRAPANISDLAALALDHLDEIAHELRHANDDGFRHFWNISQGKPVSQRDENLCRDELLQRLRPRLSAQGVSIDPEADHAADKRADLQLDYRNQFALPIEIKRDSHPELWKALRNQLMAQYVNAPKSQGHGIYLVFWFGDPTKPMPATLDGGKKPKSAQELQARLEVLLNDEERRRVFVRVLDVSWPN